MNKRQIQILATIVLASVALSSISGCDGCVQILAWIYDFETKEWTCAWDPKAEKAKKVKGALCIENGLQTSTPTLTLNGSPVSIDSAVSEAHRNRISARLEELGFFVPAEQFLVFFQTTGVLSVNVGDVLETSIVIQTSGGEPATGRKVAGGGTSEEVLNAPDPLDENNFLAFSSAIPCPTISEWGMASMTLVLVTVGCLIFGRRRRAAA